MTIVSDFSILNDVEEKLHTRSWRSSGHLEIFPGFLGFGLRIAESWIFKTGVLTSPVISWSTRAFEFPKRLERG